MGRLGLLPRLETNTAHQLLGSRDWKLVFLNPGAEPLAELADKMSVARLGGNLSGDVRLLDFMRRDLLERFSANPSELAQVIEQATHLRRDTANTFNLSFRRRRNLGGL